MAMPVVNGAMCSCTFGVAPCPLMATSQQQALAVNMPVATISYVTLATFGKSNGRQCNGGRTGRSDANAVYACPGRRMGARFSDRTGGR